MKIFSVKNLLPISLALLIACADNSFEEYPLDDNFPLQLVLDAEEGGALPDAEDVEVEFQFSDLLPQQKLPNSVMRLDYSIVELEDDMAGHVEVDKIIYEVEVDDCVFERELAFETSGDGLTGTIIIEPDPDLASVPESFEIVFSLPGLDDTEGGFKVQFLNLQSSENILLGNPNVFEYEVLDNDVAGEWSMEITSESEFEAFKEVFGPINPDLAELSFEEITGNVTAEFEFEEMKFVIELTETEEVTSCEDGETETEVVNKEIEIECDYDADEGEIELEGSHPIINDSGVVENELDFIVEGEYSGEDEELSLRFYSVVDEDNFVEDEELFQSEDGVLFTFQKD